MKKGFVVLFPLLVGILFFSGCAGNQPYSKSQNTQQYTYSFNPNDKKIVFVKSKPFSVPRSATYDHILITSMEAKKYRQAGISCNAGDLVWAYKPNQVKTKAEFNTLINKGYIQCTHPLGNKEYQYMLNREKERTRVLNELAGFNTQKIKVEHSGSIYHY